MRQSIKNTDIYSMRMFFCFCALFLWVNSAWAICFIASVKYNFGRTRIAAFERTFGKIQGRRFTDTKQLKNYLDDLRQRMATSGMFRSFTVATFLEDKTETEEKIQVQIDVEESWPAAGMIFPYYTTAKGFTVNGGGFFPNLGGQLFDTTIWLSYNAEPRNGGLAWGDPTYTAGVGIPRISCGTRWTMGGICQVQRQSHSVYDRGVMVLVHRSLQVRQGISFSWRISPQWMLKNMADYMAGFYPEIEYQPGRAQ